MCFFYKICSRYGVVCSLWEKFKINRDIYHRDKLSERNIFFKSARGSNYFWRLSTFKNHLCLSLSVGAIVEARSAETMRPGMKNIQSI